MLIVASCIAILMGTRVVTMNYTLIPLAKWGGIRTGRDQTRFAEQGWLLICTSVSWTIGMVGYLLNQMPYTKQISSISWCTPTTGLI
jgi:very-long-chain ceramide synthase